MKVERTIEIAAPPERVYDVVMDPRHLEDWVTIHHSLDDAPDGSLEQGSELTQCLKLAGRRFHVHWKVVENDPCRRVVWDGQGPVHSHARVVYEFEANGGGTRFSYCNEYDLPGGVLGRMAGGAVRRVTGKEVDATLDRLKRLVE
jgi:carbon monoxide dehydrogenase subunit G